MAFGVLFHRTGSVEELLNGREHVVVLDMVMMVQGVEQLLVEEKEVTGFLSIRLY